MPKSLETKIVQCDYCGAIEPVDLLEVWGREFQLETCCEAMQEAISEAVSTGSRDGWIRSIFEKYGIPCRSIVAPESDITLKIDFGLRLTPIDLATTKAFIEEHHAHHKPSLSWRWGHAVANGEDIVGVCMVGRPVARMIDSRTTVEVTRMCTRRDLPREFAWNACSMLYGAAAREARRRRFAKIITYILDNEEGTTLRAAGWRCEAKTKGGSWNRRSRWRLDKAPTGRKWRYGKVLDAKRV